jgi:hypothetical protein
MAARIRTPAWAKLIVRGRKEAQTWVLHGERGQDQIGRDVNRESCKKARGYGACRSIDYKIHICN